MSTPEQPATPALTRKQLRDIRNTGATPIVSGDGPADEHAVPADDATAVEPAPEATAPDHADEAIVEATIEPTPEPTPEPVPTAAAAPLPRAAIPAVMHDLPGTDASVDLGVAPLTRRQARQQERIRTASVPVITPEVAAAHAASQAAGPDAGDHASDEPAEEAHVVAEEADAVTEDATTDAEPSSEELSEQLMLVQAEPVVELEQIVEESDSRDGTEDESADRAVVNPRFGAELLAGDVAQADLPPSFDQLIGRSASGSSGTGNALILSQAPSAAPLVAPVNATGEVLITGTFDLPEGLGSMGHAVGTTDGKEADAVLVDGELPAHSSPTPIAASAAISTVKNGGDIIKPPAPEKGGRLMLTLAITAGVLALALVGVLILAFVTGVF